MTGEGRGEGGDTKLVPLPCPLPPGEGKRLAKEIFLQNLKERIEQLKKKRSSYGEILDFYRKVKEAQDKAKASLKIDPIKLKKEWKELLAKEGFSLIQKEDFLLDIEAAAKLLERLFQIGEEANPHMAEQTGKIREALDNKKVDLRDLSRKGVREQRIDQVADEFGLDKKIFDSEQRQTFD